MKNFTLIFLIIAASSLTPSLAQVTITEADVMNYYSMEATITSSTAFSVPVNIGSTSGNNTWDFSAFIADSIASLTYVAPSGTPFASDFNGANRCQYFTATEQDTTIDFYSYSKIGDGKLETYGNGIIISVNNLGSKALTTYVPPQLTVQFPVTNGSNWSSSDSMLISIDLFGTMYTMTRIKIISGYLVDAYGTLKLPGGQSEDALRIRQEMVQHIEVFPGFLSTRIKSIDYLFLTKSGQYFSVSTEDTLTTSGIIVGDASWSLMTNTTNIPTNPTLPTELNMTQNQPNPFRLGTLIKYSVPGTSEVSLSIYDLTGRKIRTLVKATKTAGNYEVVWNGKDDLGNLVRAGFYISKLQNATSIRTMKMLRMQ